MKFLHIGDLHLGKTVNGFSLLEDQRKTLENLLEDVAGRGVEALILAGDVYDSGQPSAGATEAFGRFLYQAVYSGYEVFVIPGNHDSAVRLNYAAELLEEEGVHIAEPYRGELLSYELEDGHGPVRVWLMPFLRPADVRAVLGRESEIGNDFTAAIRAVLDEEELDPSERNVLVAHQFVTAGGEGPELSDSETVWVGTAGNVDVAVFEDFDYVALGHLHRPQAIGRETVRYGGSLLKFSYSEIGHEKSAVLVDLGPKGEVSVELVPLRPPRDLREIRGTLEELVERGRSGTEDVDDYVHAVLTDEEPPLHALHRLRQVYPHVMGIDSDNTRTRTESDLSQLTFDLGEMHPLELFGQFFREQNGRELRPEELKALEAALESVFVGEEA